MAAGSCSRSTRARRRAVQVVDGLQRRASATRTERWTRRRPARRLLEPLVRAKCRRSMIHPTMVASLAQHLEFLTRVVDLDQASARRDPPHHPPGRSTEGGHWNRLRMSMEALHRPRRWSFQLGWVVDQVAPSKRQSPSGTGEHHPMLLRLCRRRRRDHEGPGACPSAAGRGCAEAQIVERSCIVGGYVGGGDPVAIDDAAADVAVVAGCQARPQS